MINTTTDELVTTYFERFPAPIKQQLELIAQTIQKVVPDAKLVIKYAIPTLVQNGNIISFGGWKNHIGIYPVPREVPVFDKALSAYAGGKGTLQLPFDKPLPIELITKIVHYNYEMVLKRHSKKAPSIKNFH